MNECGFWNLDNDEKALVKSLTESLTQIFTITMEEIWSYVKRATDLMLTMSEDIRKVFAEI